MRKIMTILIVSLLSIGVVSAQTRSLAGKVTDSKGAAVPGATITEKGTKNAVSADSEGNYTLSVSSSNATVVISAAGYLTQELPAGKAAKIQLYADLKNLNEVVVTAYGVSRQTKELGYSTAKVKASELTQAKVVNLQNGLTGKVSGLNVSTTNSGVFANTRITLRGIRSLTGNNQPMLVLDGVPVALSFLNSINPNDIADVSIMKSSTGTAVYGPDGVNGAIIITSKKGTKGRPVVTLSNTTQLENIAYLPKFQKQFGGGYAADAFGNGTFEPIEQQSWGPAFDGSIRQFGQTGPNGEKLEMPFSYNKNGRKNFFQTGVTSQTDVSFSTGDFYLSAQNVSINGTIPDDKNNRRSVNLRAEKEYNRFKAGFSLRYTQTEYDITSNNQLVYYGVTSAPGNYDLSRFKNWRTDYFSSPDGYYTPYLDNNGKTPYFAKDNNREKGLNDEFFGNTQFDFKATDWLTLTYRVGLTISNADSKTTRGAFNYSAYHLTLRDHGSQNITSAVNNSSFMEKRLTSEVFANMNKSFGKFGTNLLIGQSFREISGRSLSVGSNNLGNATLYSVALRKGEPNVGVGNSKQRLERYFGKLSIDYNKWAFLEATGSYDYDSRLVNPSVYSKKSDIGFFYPGASASIILSEAIPMVKASNFISYLKVRAAASKTGNVNLSPYGFENIFAASTFFPFGDLLGFQATSTTVAKAYQPEFVVNKEVGIEVGFLRNRINFEATYYNQNNTDQVINAQQSNTSGYTTSILNAASFVNKGLELDLKLTPLVKLGQVNIDFKINYTHQENKVTSLVGDIKELGLGNYNYVIVGQSAYKFKLTDYVRDAQGHVIVDKTTGMPTQNPNLSTFGKTTPDNLVGLSINANWKGFSLSVVADYRGGSQIVADQLGGFMDDNGISARSAQNGRRAFVFPNSVYDDGSGKFVPNTDVYTQSYGRLFWNSDLNTSVISNYLASGDFWKLREVAINYEIPVSKFGSKFSNVVKGASIGISGRNLLMWLPKSNQWTDPEFQGGNGNSAYTGNASGRSTAYNLPPTRIFGANLTVRF